MWRRQVAQQGLRAGARANGACSREEGKSHAREMWKQSVAVNVEPEK